MKENPLGPAAGVRDRPDQSGTPPQERIPGSREPQLLPTRPAAIRSTLAEIGKRLGRKALAQVACVADPDTIRASPEAHCEEVRWIQTPLLSRQAPNRTETAGANPADGQREFRLSR